MAYAATVVGPNTPRTKRNGNRPNVREPRPRQREGDAHDFGGDGRVPLLPAEVERDAPAAGDEHGEEDDAGECVRERRAPRRTDHPESRKTEEAEDEQGVQHDVRRERDEADVHRGLRVARSRAPARRSCSRIGTPPRASPRGGSPRRARSSRVVREQAPRGVGVEPGADRDGDREEQREPQRLLDGEVRGDVVLGALQP